MLTTTEVKVNKDLENKKIIVTKFFNAALQTVWEAWTTKEVLDQWWAPKPWRAETKSMEFKEGGSWVYAMVGPENERHYSRADYIKIENGKSFEGLDAFTDEQGKINTDMPRTKWKVEFNDMNQGTMVTTTITADKRESLEEMLKMGFEEGFKMGLNNLEEYLESHS